MEKKLDGELPERPRCPTCHALVGMQVTGAYGWVDGSIRVSMACSYQRRNAGRREPCRQPIVIVSQGRRIVYCFPPDWETANALNATELIDRYGRT